MACLDMYNNQNNEHNKTNLGPPPISPRISFSNDFVESTSHSHHQMMRTYRDAPVSSDFEFSVTNYSMMSADELFSQGRLLPLKESCNNNQFQKTTLRDELMVEDDDGVDFSLRPPKSSTRWKGFLGLRKSHIGSRKLDKSESSGEKRSVSVHHEANKTNSQVIN